MFKFLNSKRKSISLLIATIFLVAVIVPSVFVLFNWGKIFTSDKLPYVMNGHKKLYIQPRGFSNNQEIDDEFGGTWEEAMAYCAELDANQAFGHKGWRLPTYSEFESIFNNYKLNKKDDCLIFLESGENYIITVECINQSIKKDFINFRGFDNYWYWTLDHKIYDKFINNTIYTLITGEFNSARCVRDP